MYFFLIVILIHRGLWLSQSCDVLSLVPLNFDSQNLTFLRSLCITPIPALFFFSLCSQQHSVFYQSLLFDMWKDNGYDHFKSLIPCTFEIFNFLLGCIVTPCCFLVPCKYHNNIPAYNRTPDRKSVNERKVIKIVYLCLHISSVYSV